MNLSQDQIPGIAENDCGAMVVMSDGMGVDSTAILLRWLTEPSSRDFDLRDLIVITAHTGDEFEQTVRDVEEVVLPVLRRHGVRFIQVGRTQRKTTASGEGVIVLDDSTAPARLHTHVYRLSDEMLSAGTLPQVGGARVCSIHAKGNCLDPIIATMTAGRRYRHVVGFESGETARAAKDALFNNDRRTAGIRGTGVGIAAGARSSSPRSLGVSGRSQPAASAPSPWPRPQAGRPWWSATAASLPLALKPCSSRWLLAASTSGRPSS